jgi:hypothetical protein
VTKDILCDLFQIPDIVIVDGNGEEVLADDDGKLVGVSPDMQYIVASEKDLESDDEDAAPKQININPQRYAFMTKARRELIRDFYKPLHPHIFNLDESFFVPTFLSAVKNYKNSMNNEDLMSILTKETDTGIYSFEIFNDKFCKELLEEADNFEHSGLPVSRPNSMNNYGVILDEIGFEDFFNKLTDEYILPFTQHLYPQDGGDTLDGHHAFIVQYKLTEDLDLGFHYDSSEVTLNLCLGKEFQGGSLYFCGLLKDRSTHKEKFEFHHKPGRALLHIGKHRHGANAIQGGERYNLIVWFTSTHVRTHHNCNCGHTH